MVEDNAFGHKIDYVTIVKDILNLEGHYWFKSYGDFAEWVDFAYRWSFIGKGSASAACAAGLSSNTTNKFTDVAKLLAFNFIMARWMAQNHVQTNRQTH